MLENQLSRYGAVTRTLPATLGKVFFIVNGADSWAGDMLNEFPVDRDGVSRVYVHSATSTTVTSDAFTAAISSVVAGRDDHIIVMPSTTTYYINALLSLSKSNMHLVSPTNQATEYGSMNKVRLQQIGTGLAIMEITSGGIEVAGFYLKNISTYAHITVPTTGTTSGWGLNIHHNTFVSRSSTTSLPMLDCNGDGASYSEISHNWFQSQVTGGAFTNGIIDVEDGAAKTTIVHNLIQLANNTATYGIRNKAVHNLVGYNVLTEDLGTFTSAISSIAGGSVIGNRCAVASGHFSDASATTVVGYCDNWDAVTFATSGANDIMTKQLET